MGWGGDGCKELIPRMGWGSGGGLMAARGPEADGRVNAPPLGFRTFARRPVAPSDKSTRLVVLSKQAVARFAGDAMDRYGPGPVVASLQKVFDEGNLEGE